MNERSIFMEALELDDPQRAGGLPPPGVRRRRPAAGSGSRPCSRRIGRTGSFVLDRVPAVDLVGHRGSASRRRAPRHGRSAPTSCWSRSAKGAWASSTWPSRQQPVRRKVALKIIKPGMDTRQVIARFEAERQALALMDHPNIAQVLDAGATDIGPALLRHGAGPRHPDHRLLRPRTALDPASGWSCSSRSARPCSTPIRRGSSTATSSRRTSWSRCTTARRCPR